ncbi:MAG: amino acid decarboxylase, partial [Clostridia bacterium]|nr:amino acid decarboxylase [Clostridia bacterium]
MKTPICDFIEDYIKSEPNRLHMPAHKGKELIGFEKYDITELSGADSLYTANGIIKQSEENSSRLFGCDSFYSAEGSSLCIRAMLYLLKSYGITRFISARNSHSAFLSACALCDISPIWLYGEGLLSCDISLKELEDKLCTSDEPSAVYITSPDYLGNIADIGAISELCKKYGALLCVDCAHGAY